MRVEIVKNEDSFLEELVKAAGLEMPEEKQYHYEAGEILLIYSRDNGDYDREYSFFPIPPFMVGEKEIEPASERIEAYFTLSEPATMIGLGMGEVPTLYTGGKYYTAEEVL